MELLTMSSVEMKVSTALWNLKFKEVCTLTDIQYCFTSFLFFYVRNISKSSLPRY